MPNRLASTLLALAASSGSCSAALWGRGEILAERFAEMRRGQSEAILPMVLTVLEEGGAAFGDLDAIAVTRGPGSFTGVRIGLAAARGLALACEAPAIGLTAFEIYAAQLMTAGVLSGTEGAGGLVVIESGREEVFAQAFDSEGAPLGEADCLLPAALARSLPQRRWHLAGNAAARAAPALEEAGLETVLSAACRAIAASDLLPLALARPLPKPGAPAPTPLYLRSADVSQPSKALLKAARIAS